MKYVFLICATLLLPATVTQAQRPGSGGAQPAAALPPASAALDTAVATVRRAELAGAAAGRAAADTVWVRGYFFVGALSGLPIGLFVIQGWLDGNDGRSQAASGAGALLAAGAIGRASSSRPPLPRGLAVPAGADSAAYTTAFSKAYVQRVQSRRTSRALLGTVTGVGLAYAFLIAAFR